MWSVGVWSVRSVRVECGWVEWSSEGWCVWSVGGVECAVEASECGVCVCGVCSGGCACGVCVCGVCSQWRLEVECVCGWSVQ